MYFSAVANTFAYEWLCIVNFREMRAYKALVTFDSKKSMEEALSTLRELLLNHFKELRW